MGKTMLRCAFCGVLTMVVAACGRGELGRSMSSWQGSQFDEVVQVWGEPDICEIVDGRRICSWHDMVSGYSLSGIRICVRSLEIDAEGAVIGWRWRGDYCHTTTDRVMARAPGGRPDALVGEARADGAFDVAVMLPQD
jgi:hypothetical protein